MRNTLTVTCITGLCNRLRVLLSGKALAEASGREFAMVWKRDEPCGALFDELFCNAWNVRGDVGFDAARGLNLEGVVPSEMPDLLESTSPALSVRHWGWLINAERFPSHVPLEKRCQELIAELELLTVLSAQVKNFRSEFFRPQMIGVHLRLGDRAASNPHLKPSIPTVMTHVDKFLDRAPHAGILLCSDDGAPEPYTGAATPVTNAAAGFVKRYGKRVVMTKPLTLDRRSAAAIQAALVDLYLLRATDFFVGTFFSAFSEFVVYGRDVPSVFPVPRASRYRRVTHLLKRLGRRFKNGK